MNVGPYQIVFWWTDWHWYPRSRYADSPLVKKHRIFEWRMMYGPIEVRKFSP